MTRTHEVTFYVQIQREPWTRWYRGRYVSAVARRLTGHRPEEPLPGAVVVALKVRIPDEAFEPLRPSAVIDVPLDLIQQPVEVEAVSVDG